MLSALRLFVGLRLGDLFPGSEKCCTARERGNGCLRTTKEQFVDDPVAVLVLFDREIFNLGGSRAVDEGDLAPKDLGDDANLAPALSEAAAAKARVILRNIFKGNMTFSSTDIESNKAEP